MSRHSPDGDTSFADATPLPVHCRGRHTTHNDRSEDNKLAHIRLRQRIMKAPRLTTGLRPQLQAIQDATWDDDLASMLYLADR